MNILPPLLLHYYITYRCNARCSFCEIWRSPANRKSPLAHPADVFRNLRETRRMGLRFVDFTGGEPLLHPDLPAFLRKAKELGFKTSVTTNCTLYPQRAQELAGLVDFLHFSLDAATAAEHDSIRGKKSFARVMQSLEMARDIGEKPDILYTVTDRNIDSLEPLAHLARGLGLILIVNPVFSHHQKWELDVALLDEIERFRHHPNVYINTAFHRLRRQGGNSRHKPRCRVVSSTIVISPENQLLLPCYHFARQKISITDSIRQIRKTEQFKYYLRNQGRFDFCQGCTLNCYFDPSFVYKIDVYFWQSLLAKTKYAWQKYVKN